MREAESSFRFFARPSFGIRLSACRRAFASWIF
jgi:hypothetical protein